MPRPNADTPAPPGTSSTKCTYQHIVVVHGIGDQVPNETALNFMNEFLRALSHDGYTLQVDNLIQDLEGLHPGVAASGRRPSFRPSFTVATHGDRTFVIGFSEVWWQYITNGYLDLYGGSAPIPIFTWAHSINTRFLRGGRAFHVAADAINNLEKMLGLLRKLAFIFKQSGRFVDILSRFLGDVEMYTESEIIRTEINDRFKTVLSRVPLFAEEARQQIRDLGFTFDSDNPEIYVVAHSEGTVVSYSSLVEAFEHNAAWAPMVKGLVTLGSPLDKHYTTWNNAFQRQVYTGPPADNKIPWRNYWDVSDPVGYGLKVLFTDGKNGRLDRSLDAPKLFQVISDEPFARYPVPGLAHVAYWTDPDIHAEIIYKIMNMGTGRQRPAVESRWWGHGHVQDIGDRISYCAGRALTIGAAVFFLTKLLGGLNPVLKWLGPVSPALISMLNEWTTWTLEQPTGLRALNVALWVLAPFAVSEALWSLYLRSSGGLAAFIAALRRLAIAAWALLVLAACLALSQTEAAAQLKDYLGYATGLVVTLLAWQLHTTVHLGIVQLWRYTKGWDTKFEAEEITAMPEKRRAAGV